MFLTTIYFKLQNLWTKYITSWRNKNITTNIVEYDSGSDIDCNHEYSYNDIHTNCT